MGESIILSDFVSSTVVISKSKHDKKLSFNRHQVSIAAEIILCIRDASTHKNSLEESVFFRR